MEQENFEDIWDKPIIDYLELEEYHFQMEFGPMHRYAEAIEKLLVEHTEKALQNMPMPSRKMSEDERQDFYAEYASDMDEIERAFPKILRYSLFVYSYSFFERALLRLAEHYRKNKKLELSPDDLRHRGIERARVYIKKVIHAPFPDESLAWKDIKVLNIIRNQIVHNEGKLSNNSNDLKTVKAFAEKWHDDISADYDQIELHKNFIFRVLNTFRTFSNELFTGLRSSPRPAG